MNEKYARRLFVRAGSDKVVVLEADRLTEKREGYQSPVPFHQLWTIDTDIIGWLFIAGSGINGSTLLKSMCEV